MPKPEEATYIPTFDETKLGFRRLMDLTHLGPDDITALGLYREQLYKAAAKLRDTEPCDRDHCPTNCSPNCHLVPTGANNAKA